MPRSPFLSSFVTDYTVGGHVQGQSGNRAQSRLPTADVFKVKGGHILLAVNNEKQFGALSRAIGLPDLAKDPRFRDWPARVANDAALRAIIEEAFAGDDDKTWEARLSKADVPCSRVWSHRRDRRASAARPSRRAAARGDALRPA